MTKPDLKKENNEKLMKVRKWLFFLIVLFAGLISLCILICCISKPQDNLIPRHMMITVPIASIMGILLFWIWSEIISDKLERINDWIFGTGISLYGMALFLISIFAQNNPSLHDYNIMLDAAGDIAKNREIATGWYYEIIRHNFKPAMYLGYLTKVSDKIGLNLYYAGCFISILVLIGAILAVRYLAGKDKTERKKYQIPVLLMFIMLLPIVCYTSFFYTDTLSFGLGIIGIALFKFAYNVKTKAKILLFVLSGLLFGFAYTLKVTCLIPLIAAVAVYVFFCKKNAIPCVCICVVAALIIVEGTTLMANKYEPYQKSKERAVPVIHYIALGLCGDGSIEANKEYGEEMMTMPTSENITDLAVNYMKDNKENFWSIYHYIEKTRCNFGTGTFKAVHAMYYEKEGYENNIIHKMFHPYGEYYWRTSQICFTYLFSFWTIIAIGSIVSVIDVIKKKTMDVTLIWSDLAIIGIFVFLMLWEACSRQMYNQMPGMILCVIMNLRKICEMGFFHKEKRKENGTTGN